MGNKGGKVKKLPKQPKLSSKECKFLTKQTGMSKDEITEIFNQFNENNPDGSLDSKEFTRLYIKLRPEPAELIDEISQYVFGAFDKDNSGTINFNEFMVIIFIRVGSEKLIVNTFLSN